MKYLAIRNTKNQIRADGSLYAVPLYVHKNRKYGKTVKTETVSVKRPVLVTGAHDSGKTRWLKRMYEQGRGIWGGKIKADPLWLGALRPVAAWCDSPPVVEWWEKTRLIEEKRESETARRPWVNLKQWERAEALPNYVQDSGAVVFIDDAHKLSGRKLQLARECVLACRISVISASEEQRIPPNLRSVVMRRDPQIFRLDSDVAYDATSAVMWFFIITLMAAGMWEAGAVLGGLKALSGGRRSARQD
jgi:hypothetical protein